MRKRAVVLFSGGVDSTLALAWARARGFAVITLEFEHPARPSREREAARRIRNHFGVRRVVRVSLDQRLDRLGFAPDGYLAGRNLILHAAAQAVAEACEARAVVAGHLSSDKERFPDAQKRFLERFVRLAAQGRPRRHRVPLRLPLIGKSLHERARLAVRLQAPLELTWSCWRDRRRPCGVCEKCTDRAEFVLALGRLSPGSAGAGRSRTWPPPRRG